MRLLCCCYAVALRLLCGCYAKPSKTSHLTIFNEFVKVVTCISRLLPNKNNLKFVPDSLISIENSIKLKDLMPGSVVLLAMLVLVVH